MSGSGDRRAQSEVLGVALLLGITILGTGAILTFGGHALDATQSSTEVGSVGLSMTQLDAQAALVGLGESDSQTIDLAAMQHGHVTVEPNAGSLEVIHKNNDGTTAETYLDKTNLGAVVYSNGDQTVTYQAGGVWQSQGSGSVMLSPPEIHYHHATLTLPLVIVGAHGSRSASGRVTATVTRASDTKLIYPDATHTNPLRNGYILMKVKSRYYGAWADYFRTRTKADVKDFAGNQTTIVRFKSMPEMGALRMPDAGNSITVRGLKDGTGSNHALGNYNMTLTSDKQNGFGGLDWSMHAKSGSDELEFHVENTHGDVCSGGQVVATVYYRNTTTQRYQVWSRSFTDAATKGFTIDCSGSGPAVIHANFTSNVKLNYTEGDTKMDHLYFEPGTGDTQASSVTFTDYSNTQYALGAQNKSRDVTKHYFWMMRPTFDLTVTPKTSGNGNGNGGKVDSGSSTLNIVYANNKDYVTYLHITKNTVNVTVN